MYRWSNAENFGSVRLMVREKISSQTDRQTDGHGEYISVFFPMKKALKIAKRSHALMGCLYIIILLSALVDLEFVPRYSDFDSILPQFCF